ncbi:MAG: 2-oxoacid:ferredoxin oxidoreductase subunit beta [Verrucomicrobia bacterium]|nr:2-oxoacid:ferredoxin oxidoreductase subunit beta [Verrucomicrobiota bacterium]
MSATLTEPTSATASAPSATQVTPSVNRLGLTQAAYRGAPSTLCSGCGHDAITHQIIRATFELGIEPHRVAKLSGIGCSSKTTAYFLGQSHGFNGVHGRMAAVATGVNLANRTLINIGVSGDGDTASIGLGQFLHMLRRNVQICYVIENNGVYGLTKGQFSATADKGSVQKKGAENEMTPIDCCALAIEMGCEYVGRSFSGDMKQLSALLKGALSHRGAALIDVVSPCISFNNHEGSTKSYKFAKDHEEPLHDIGFVPAFEAFTAEYAEGATHTINLPDGARIVLKKVHRDYDPTDKTKALELLSKARDERLFLTGLLYHASGQTSMVEQKNLVDDPLATLPQSRVRPPPEVLAAIMDSLK